MKNVVLSIILCGLCSSIMNVSNAMLVTSDRSVVLSENELMNTENTFLKDAKNPNFSIQGDIEKWKAVLNIRNVRTNFVYKWNKQIK